jgi:hypothetical protein
MTHAYGIHYSAKAGWLSDHLNLHLKVEAIETLRSIKAPHHPWPEIAARNIGANLSAFSKPDSVKYKK